MNTQTETKMTVRITETPRETENPMQERHLSKVMESVEETAEAVIAARRLEAQKETGRASTLLFVP